MVNGKSCSTLSAPDRHVGSRPPPDPDSRLTTHDLRLTIYVFSVNSETRNSGVTICGTKKPAAVLKRRMRACRRTLARWPKFHVTRESVLCMEATATCR